MKKNLCEMIFILGRSGSMRSSTDDTICSWSPQGLCEYLTKKLGCGASSANLWLSLKLNMGIFKKQKAYFMRLDNEI